MTILMNWPDGFVPINSESLNLAETSYIIYANKPIRAHAKVKMKVEFIKQDYIKFLGIFADHELNWNKNFSFVKSNLSSGRIQYLLNTNKHILRSDVLQTVVLYYACLT